MFNTPHGAICASLLPSVMKHNVKVIEELGSGSELKRRYREIARILTGDGEATISDGVNWLENLAEHLDIPGLGSMGITPSDFDQILAKAKSSSSMRKNPVELPDPVLHAILQEAY